MTACCDLLLSWLHDDVHISHQLLSNHCGYKIHAIMKCGTYSTVVIMQAWGGGGGGGGAV